MKTHMNKGIQFESSVKIFSFVSCPNIPEIELIRINKEAVVMGSRYATKQEVIDSLELVARGDVWPLVTDKRDMNEAEQLHSLVEDAKITGRAAILIK